jgi:hypothetical protein
MRDLSLSLNTLHLNALTAALRAALPGKVIGVSAAHNSLTGSVPSGSILVHVDDSTTPADETTIAGLVTAHDPVWISVDKPIIVANGTDAAAVTVYALKPGAAAVTLSVSINGGAPADWSIALTGGVGSDTLTSLDPATITISVKNAANRSTDTLTVRAA